MELFGELVDHKCSTTFWGLPLTASRVRDDSLVVMAESTCSRERGDGGTRPRATLVSHVGGALNALNSNARNTISSQSFSCKRKCLKTSARESL
jgi:hypothetical protein